MRVVAEKVTCSKNVKCACINHTGGTAGLMVCLFAKLQKYRDQRHSQVCTLQLV